jgi:hypothetical protein
MATDEKQVKEKVPAQIKAMQERAATAQAQARDQRKQAPDISLSQPWKSVPQKYLINKYAKRDGFKGQDDPAGKHYMFGDRNETAQMPDFGYEPVTDKSASGTVEQVTCQGDPLWAIPTDIYQARVDEGAARSRHIAERMVQAETDKANRSPISSGESLQTAKAQTPEADRILHEAGLL